MSGVRVSLPPTNVEPEATVELVDVPSKNRALVQPPTARTDQDGSPAVVGLMIMVLGTLAVTVVSIYRGLRKPLR